LRCSDPKPAPKPETKTQASLSEASDGPALVGDEVAAPSEKKLQLGELFFTSSKLTKVRPHPSLVGDDEGIKGIGFGLTAVGIAGSVYGESGNVENSLWFRSHSSASKRAPHHLLADLVPRQSLRPTRELRP
jgi:hypothetical protein